MQAGSVESSDEPVFIRLLLMSISAIKQCSASNITMGDYKIKEETEFEVGKTDAEEELEDAGDKIKAGAKAFGKKVVDPDRDLESEYQDEKIKEKLD